MWDDSPNVAFTRTDDVFLISGDTLLLCRSERVRLQFGSFDRNLLRGGKHKQIIQNVYLCCCRFTCAERWRALTRHFEAMDPRSASDSHRLKYFGNGEHKQHLCDFFQNTNKLTFPLSHGSQCHWKRKNYELSQFQFQFAPEMPSVWVQINSGKVASTGVSTSVVVVILALKLREQRCCFLFVESLWVLQIHVAGLSDLMTLAVTNERYRLFLMWKSQ